MIFAETAGPDPDQTSPVRKLWPFLQKNWQVLGWLSGGFVVLESGLWVMVTFFYSPYLARVQAAHY